MSAELSTKLKSKSLYIQLLNSFSYQEFVCGMGAAFINIALTYPLNKVIFRQMLHNSSVKAAARQIYSEGIYYLYRGLLPPLCQKTLSFSIMFGMYEQARRPLISTGMNPYMAKSIAGIYAGTMEVILMPLERIQTLLSDSHYHKDFKNTAHAFKVIGAQYGFKEYYRGLVPILIRNGSSNALFFIFREELQEKIPKSGSQLRKTVLEFVNGAVIGVTLSCIFYPLNVMKIAAQCTVGGEFRSFRSVAMQVYKERGSSIWQIYNGVSTNCTRAFFSWGITNTAYESLKKIVY